MIVRRSGFGLVLLAGLVAWGAPARPLAQAPTADEVAAKYLQAIGGPDALAKITSRRETGTVTLATQAGDLSGPIEILSKTPNKTRASMTLDLSSMGAGAVQVVQRFDGTTGVMSNSMQGDVEITGSMLEDMKNSLFPTPFLHYKENGTTLTLKPNDTINGKSMLVVQVTPKAGPPAMMYFDPQTYLIARTDVVVNSPTLGGDVEDIADISDYRDVGGIKVPFKRVNTAAGQTVTITLTKVEHNVTIDDSIFSKSSH